MFQNVNELPGLQEMIDQNMINCTTHSKFPLRIYNYTNAAQHSGTWNEATLNCRGLITNFEGFVVSRPFKKFFNLEQLQSIPNEPFTLWEKMDGSLGISYFYDGWYIATRGSFHSDQAKKATEILNTRYAHLLMDKAYTYCFEIIYPENRIVVNYGETQDIVLTGVVHIKSGETLLPDDSYGFPIARQYFYTDIHDLKSLAFKNAEGFVVKWKSGIWCKIKFEEYLRLHALLDGITVHRIWEILKCGANISQYTVNVPDEFYKFVKETAEDLTKRFLQHKHSVERIFYSIPESLTQKEFAMEAKKYPFYTRILFSLRNRKYNVDELLWNLVEP